MGGKSDGMRMEGASGIKVWGGEGVVDGVGMSVVENKGGNKSVWSTEVQGSGVEGDKSWFVNLCYILGKMSLIAINFLPYML